MTAIGAAASVLAIVEVVGRVYVSATSFMRDIKAARREMKQVRKDISGLSTVLRMVAEDLDHRGRSSLPGVTPHDHQLQNIVDIANSCGAVLLEIKTVLRKCHSRLAWITSGRERVGQLRARLETHKSSLAVALAYRTMVVVHDMKEDITWIVCNFSVVLRSMALHLEKADNIKRKASGGQGSADGTGDSPGAFMLDHFLKDCRSDAQTIQNNIEYQQDQDVEEDQDIEEDQDFEVDPELAPEFSPELTPSSPSPIRLFKNGLGCELQIPVEQCRTWAHIKEISKCSHLQGSDDAEEIENGRYTLYHDGQALSPASWNDFVDVERSITPEVMHHDPIRFRDVIGRKFEFPWKLAQTWEGIKDLVTKTFHHEDFLRPFIQEACYDLIGPDNMVILPEQWQQFVKPGMGITMRMWPSEQDTRLVNRLGTLQGDARGGRAAPLQKRKG